VVGEKEPWKQGSGLDIVGWWGRNRVVEVQVFDQFLDELVHIVERSGCLVGERQVHQVRAGIDQHVEVGRSLKLPGHP
jgi:hypothetical protein